MSAGDRFYLNEAPKSKSTVLMGIEGLPELQEILESIIDDFGAKDTQKILSSSAREAMKLTESSLKSLIQSQFQLTKKPYLIDTVRLSGRKPTAKDRKSAYFNEGDVAIGEVSVYTDKRGISQEFGNARVPAKPFLRISLEYSATAIVDQLSIILAKKINLYKSKKV
jgi:hypothetical protein